MHAVIRRYTGATELMDEMDRRADEVEELLTSVPGFAAYYAVRSGTELTTVTVCEDEAGTTETTRRAAKWVKENLRSGSVSAPEVHSGEVFIEFTSV